MLHLLRLGSVIPGIPIIVKLEVIVVEVMYVCVCVCVQPAWGV